jgi:hypothetical protein
MSDEGQLERRMTAVHVRVRNDHAEVMFVESARIYRLTRDNPAYDETLGVLRAAAASHRPLRVQFDTPNGEVIERARVDNER